MERKYQFTQRMTILIFSLFFLYLLFTYFLEVMLGIEPQNQDLSYDRQML